MQSVAEKRKSEKVTKTFSAKRAAVLGNSQQSVAAFLQCGDLQEGSVRVRCPDCKHEMFVAFSCKQRCTCPSCYQNRKRK